jgi:hypothetical protein
MAMGAERWIAGLSADMARVFSTSESAWCSPPPNPPGRVTRRVVQSGAIWRLRRGNAGNAGRRAAWWWLNRKTTSTKAKARLDLSPWALGRERRSGPGVGVPWSVSCS